VRYDRFAAKANEYLMTTLPGVEKKVKRLQFEARKWPKTSVFPSSNSIRQVCVTWGKIERDVLRSLKSAFFGENFLIKRDEERREESFSCAFLTRRPVICQPHFWRQSQTTREKTDSKEPKRIIKTSFWRAERATNKNVVVVVVVVGRFSN